MYVLWVYNKCACTVIYFLLNNTREIRSSRRKAKGISDAAVQQLVAGWGSKLVVYTIADRLVLSPLFSRL